MKKRLNKKKVIFVFGILLGIIALIWRIAFSKNEAPKIKPVNTCVYVSRVKVAECEKQAYINEILTNAKIDWKEVELYIRGFKKEETLEIWAKNKTDKKFQLIKKYPFCRLSGIIGPKRKEGDRQVPEGIYYIDRFNPLSKL